MYVGVSFWKKKLNTIFDTKPYICRVLFESLWPMVDSQQPTAIAHQKTHNSQQKKT